MTRILVDTAVWIDHLHRTDSQLARLLEHGLVVTHPMVIGEIALGSIRNRSTVLSLLSGLPTIAEAKSQEILDLVEARALYGRGLGLVDASLLAAALIAGDVAIWTRDKRLAAIADSLRIGWIDG